MPDLKDKRLLPLDGGGEISNICNLQFFLYLFFTIFLFRFAPKSEGTKDPLVRHGQSPRLREVQLKVSAKRWKSPDVELPNFGWNFKILISFNYFDNLTAKLSTYVFISGTPIQRCLGLSWWKLMGLIRCLWHVINNWRKKVFPKILITTMPRTLVLGTQGVHWWFKTRQQAAGPSLVILKKSKQTCIHNNFSSMDAGQCRNTEIILIILTWRLF